jgi:hypothetical protein
VHGASCCLCEMLTQFLFIDRVQVFCFLCNIGKLNIPSKISILICIFRSISTILFLSSCPLNTCQLCDNVLLFISGTHLYLFVCLAVLGVEQAIFIFNQQKLHIFMVYIGIFLLCSRGWVLSFCPF